MASIYERLARLEANLDRLLGLAERLAGVDADERDEEPHPDAGWDDFLTDHPELVRSDAPAPLDAGRGREFTDDDVLTALVNAIRKNDKRHEPESLYHGRVWTSAVAWVIAKGEPTRSELVRVGKALARLERAGRVRDATRRGDGGRAMWTVGGDG